ncbi:MAG: HEAT repeat domain-containing protein [Planctomycetales bacterium]|nr:HEAT repeat domain-containing protein [Planctomycetales bacterium]
MISHSSYRWFLLASTAVVVAAVAVCPADEFLLKNGGRVEGTWLNSQADSPTQYLVRTDEGINIALAVDAVQQVNQPSESERLYKRYLPSMKDTADDNWKMAVWCEKAQLADQRQLHLEAVLHFNENHEEARRALGYRLVDGRWIRPDDLRREQGFVKDGANWRLPQDVQIEEKRKAAELAERQWHQQLKKLRSWLGGRRHDDALAAIKQIDDPLAADALAEFVTREQDDDVRRLFIEALGRLRTGKATQALVETALRHSVEESRQLAIDQLENYAAKPAAVVFVQALGSKDNALVKRAAEGLQRLADPDVIPQLIDALVTVHRVPINAGQEGRLGASFGNTGAGGLSVGGKAKYANRPVQNREVLEALLQVVEEPVNFQYNQQAWKDWYSKKQLPPEQFSLRRR